MELEKSFYPDTKGIEKFGCFGILKRYRLCKDERCKASKQRLRDSQCENFNATPYREKFYTWIGYEKEHDECTLYCRASGFDLFVNMNQSVTDGTPCNRPAVYYTHFYRRRAVCVEGICRAVHTSGSIRPATSSDSQTKCGSVLCQHFSGIFNKSELTTDYNYIATIPIGAMNLSVKQRKLNENFFALKTSDGEFVINGNRHNLTHSGLYKVNDDVYDYKRNKSALTARGPLNRAAILMYLVNEVNSTNDVEYNYTIPIPSASVVDEELQTVWDETGKPINETDDGTAIRSKERRHRRFKWKLLGFGECNRSCGPGTQTPIFRCIPQRESGERYYSPRHCASSEKPTFNDDIYLCNRGLCPAFWRPSNFSECKCPLGNSSGWRTQQFQCMQEQIKGNVIQVNDTLCTTRKEVDVPCDCHQQREELQKKSSDPSMQTLKRNARDSQSSSVWLMSEWMGLCTDSNCFLKANQHRSIYCARSMPKGDLCDPQTMPKIIQPCQQDCKQPIAFWVTSEWGNCTGDCFNLQRNRIVLCISNGQVVDNGNCIHLQKPGDSRRCMQSEVDYCGPRWHYSEWSECSRSCGNGVRQRHVECLDYNWKRNALIKSSNCPLTKRETIFGTCHTPCEEESDINKMGKIKNCVDLFLNCGDIYRQNLCYLNYYKTYCCRSCQGKL
ncbi:thrombospondin type-1 domain-containing protein 4-like [Drosophila willistoni]|uniref:thrombospondin type-1 domain-containing protein 4-like n=1 Tax=Drosophila willistoni TaxID=7260 RepID=UPI001F0854F6|nr:thrombospondin type-1 domain-containing protein 4-like [Drosophila willistoni]